MRFLMLIKADESSEAGQMPTAEQFQEMGDYNEALVNSGVLLTAEGLHPSSDGFRTEIKPDGERRIVQGPFTDSRDLVAGFWLLNVNSWEEMTEWARRCPAPVEVRPIYETEEFVEQGAIPQQEAERENGLREKMQRNKHASGV